MFSQFNYSIYETNPRSCLRLQISIIIMFPCQERNLVDDSRNYLFLKKPSFFWRNPLAINPIQVNPQSWDMVSYLIPCCLREDKIQRPSLSSNLANPPPIIVKSVNLIKHRKPASKFASQWHWPHLISRNCLYQ